VEIGPLTRHRPHSSKRKVCSFDCVYCQLGLTGVKTLERKAYVSEHKVAIELEKADKTRADIITFSGTGEPTLNSGIGSMVSVINTPKERRKSLAKYVPEPEKKLNDKIMDEFAKGGLGIMVSLAKGMK